jgi:peptide/nickel transport system ATP-binding protein
LQKELGFSILFITHDMSLMIELSHRMAVMYAGRFVEMGGAKQLFADPRHPYTQALIHAFPPLHGPNVPLVGLAEGVRFTDIPDLREESPGHWVALDAADSTTMSGVI